LHSQTPDRRLRNSMASSSAFSYVASGANRCQSTHSHLPPIPGPLHEYAPGLSSGSSDASPAHRRARSYTHDHDHDHGHGHNHHGCYGRQPDIPPEVLCHASPSAFSLCSSCETAPGTIRYMCAICRPKANARARQWARRASSTAHRTRAAARAYTRPVAAGAPRTHPRGARTRRSSWSRVLRVQTSLAPGASPAATLYSLASVHSHGSGPPDLTAHPDAYELCGGCIEAVGVVRALDAGFTAGAPAPSPADSQRSFSKWKHSAPRTKGQLQPMYLEELLGPAALVPHPFILSIHAYMRVFCLFFCDIPYNT
jgi:hypothetical protein